MCQLKNSFQVQNNLNHQGEQLFWKVNLQVSNKWKPFKHEELVVFLGLLTIIMGVINISRPESLLEYQRLVLEARQFFEPVFTENRRLLMFHSIFKYTSFILRTLEVQQTYALSELPKKKYKRIIRTEKNKKVLSLYFNNTIYVS